MAVGRPLKYKTVEELQEKIDGYFDNTEEENWTVTELAMVCGLDRRQLIEYAEKDQFHNTIKEAKAKIQASYERSLRKRGNAGDIFALKNFGWTDKHETDLNVKGSLSMGAAFEAIDKKDGE